MSTSTTPEIKDIIILHGSDLSKDIASQISTKLSVSTAAAASSSSTKSFNIQMVSMSKSKIFKAALLVGQAQAGDEKEETPQPQSSRLAIFIAQTIENESPPEDSGACIRFLNRKTHPNNLLKGLYFTVLGLGDSNLLLDRQHTGAKDCNQVAQKLDKRLDGNGGLGAIRFYGRGECDERTGLEDGVEPWVEGLVQKLLKA